MEREYSGDNVKLYDRGGYIESDIRKIKFNPKEIEKIYSAWAKGRPVVMGYSVAVGKKGISMRVSVFNVYSCCYIHPNAVNVTKDWLKIGPILMSNQIPSEWLELILTKIQEVISGGSKSDEPGRN